MKSEIDIFPKNPIWHKVIDFLLITYTLYLFFSHIFLHNRQLFFSESYLFLSVTEKGSTTTMIKGNTHNQDIMLFMTKPTKNVKAHGSKHHVSL